MPEGSRQPIFDFPVLSDGRQDTKNPNEWEETVWRFEGDWERGEEIGKVLISELGGKMFKAHFTFTDRDYHPVTVTGAIPETDGRPWVGKGKARAISDGRERDIDVECRNPKKWS